MKELSEHIENEWFVVRHSGEIPEIAYHSSIYFLTDHPDGPGLDLSESDYAILQEAACDRFREIILRDLLPENRDTSIYRGIKRSIVNYNRFQKFCQRQGLDEHWFTAEIGVSLLQFLEIEAMDVAGGLRKSVVNCSFQELKWFAAEIGVMSETITDDYARLCRDRS